jgi:hypothetical protein
MKLRRIALPIFFLATSLVYCVQIFLPFGRLDDFTFYAYANENFFSFATSGWSYGRPITSLTNALLFRNVDSMNDLSFIRSANVLVLLISIYMYGKIFFETRSSSKKNLLIGLLIFLSFPGIWVFLTWGQGFAHLLAFPLIVITIKLRAIKNSKFAFSLFVIGVMFIYQPFALAIPSILLFTEAFLNRRKLDVQRLIFPIAVVLMALALNYLTIRSQKNPNTRSELVYSFQEKFLWIVNEWMPRVILPHLLRPLSYISIISLLIIGLLLFRLGQRTNFKISMVLLFTIVLPWAPFIVIEDNWASSRAVLASNIALYFGIGTIFLLMPVAISKNFKSLLLKFAVLVFAVSTYAAYSGLVLPQNAEWNNVKTILRQLPPTATKVQINLAFFEQTTSKLKSYDEFGVQNSSVQESALNQLKLGAEEESLTHIRFFVNQNRTCMRVLLTRQEPIKVSAVGNMPGC